LGARPLASIFSIAARKASKAREVAMGMDSKTGGR
jgi:hypothetical protein